MKPKQTGKQAAITVAELRDLRAERNEEHNWRMRLAGELGRETAALSSITTQVRHVRRLLMQERDVLLARLDALDILLLILPQERAADGQNTG